MISNIINKEFLEFKNNINILSSRPENQNIVLYVKKIIKNCCVINFDNTYYGNLEPHIVFCNNRIMDLDKCVDVAKFFHIPLVVIDTEKKSNLVTNKIDTIFDFDPVVQIAVSKEVYLSWNKIQDYIIYPDSQSETQWQNIIYNLCKQTFKFKNNIDRKHAKK
jgi:hypothetical protein